DRAIITLNNISKNFHVYQKSRTFLLFIKSICGGSFASQTIHALHDITLAVREHDKIGIIGPNGAGKTTLLKIILGIYKPTSGTLSTQGKMIGFLQQGLGLYRELTVLDNIYLFGAMIGYRRNDLKPKIKNILSFAGLEDFIFSPIRDFSTGMLQRLAVSIIAELDTDIVFLDEILTGTDKNFKEKCFTLFETSKKTFLISSHDIDIIARLCNKTLVLDKGKQVIFGDTQAAIKIYKEITS
nr:ABC transporter ATP-binding protein [Candidatus Omnitrophota bacterium]